MSEILQVMMNLLVLLFVISSMLAMGLNLTIAQNIAPLRNGRLAVLVLVANFVPVPIPIYLTVETQRTNRFRGQM